MPPNAPTTSATLRDLEAPIAEDRPCRRCGYNLRGLRAGDRCPECGTAIGGARRARGRVGIDEAPLERLRVLRAGSLLLASGGPLGTAAFVVAVQAERISSGNDITPLAGIVAAIAFLAWAAGAWLVHSPSPERTSTPDAADGAWRTANRLLAFAPLAACGSLALHLKFNASLTWLVFAAILLLASLAGYLSLCYFASMLCAWAGDDDTAERFRVSGFVAIAGGILFGLAFSGTIVFVIVNGPGLLSTPAAVVTGLLTAYCTWGAVRSLFTLHETFHWAIKNRFASMDADVRIADRIRSRIEENQSDSSRKKARHVRNP
ncbi:MAG: hypothetical protein WCK33_07290 [Phycisphaerae bacterium]|jgi:hypothetical protein